MDLDIFSRVIIAIGILVSILSGVWIGRRYPK